MYTIRVDSSQRLLRLAMSGRVTTRDALRALSQAMTLAEVAEVTACRCDLVEVERGPAGLLVLAAAFSARYEPPMRVAFVGSHPQARIVERFMNFTGRQHALGFFLPVEDPDAWLREAPEPPFTARRRLSPTAELHARSLLGLEPVQLEPSEAIEKPAA